MKEIQEQINRIERTKYYWLAFDTVVILGVALLIIMI